MANLIQWVENQPESALYLPSNLSRITKQDIFSLSKKWQSPTSSKILVTKLSKDDTAESQIDPNRTTVLGGMCLINAVEMKKISRKEISFLSEKVFEGWYAGWYPRIDQIHDAVGIPPRLCKKLVYVVEDDFFTKRLSLYTGLDKLKLQKILQYTHEAQGHVVLQNYLRAQGYFGEIVCIYTSHISALLETALLMWERVLNHKFRTCDRDFAKVELMYTGFWLDILGISEYAVIYESAHKMKLRGWVNLDPWFAEYPYLSGINHNLGVVGYTPFLTKQGDGSALPFDIVPNFGNYKEFHILEENILWYIANLLFIKKNVSEKGPFGIAKEFALEMMHNDLVQYFNVSK